MSKPAATTTFNGTGRTRALCAGIAAVVVLDVVWVRAPFLIIVAVPFLVAAWRYRRGGLPATLGLVVAAALYVLIGVAYAVANGFHEPLDEGATGPRDLINPGDFAFVYVGTPLAAWLLVHLVGSLLRRRSIRREAMAAV
jgi:hypothetical protein